MCEPFSGPEVRAVRHTLGGVNCAQGMLQIESSRDPDALRKPADSRTMLCTPPSAKLDPIEPLAWMDSFRLTSSFRNTTERVHLVIGY